MHRTEAGRKLKVNRESFVPRGIGDASVVKNVKPRLLYFSPGSRGGIAAYAREQANAMGKAGADVQFLACEDFKRTLGDGYELRPLLKPPPCGPHASRLQSRFKTAKYILANMRRLSRYVIESGCQQVLFSSYFEYLAPLWAYKMRELARRGVVFGAVVHDPVRDAVIGPFWWHRWSVREGYSFLREAFVHEAVQLDTGLPQQPRTTVIPHGLYNPDATCKSAEQMRKDLDIPMGAKVILAFGHIRDNKNLDLAIQALEQLPDVFLVISGNEMVARQRPISYYQQLALNLGVNNRCRWRKDYIPDSEVGNYFNSADLILLTYNGLFRSASGVLNLAVGYRKPCVASAGDGNLRSAVSDYSLGIWVEPDSKDALVGGIRQWLAAPSLPEWTRYERENNWSKNAAIVLGRMFSDEKLG